MTSVTVLFTGPPGERKTMAAESLAKGLDTPLMRVQLSAVVSKYIGETEKNLRRVFREAEGSGAIVFLDEAEVLFDKRTEVRDAHDRYANTEVGFLCERIEEFSGLVIIASNSTKNIEDAFPGRVESIVDFSGIDTGPADKQNEQLRNLRELMSRKRR